jgi:hypothetical protein
MLKWPRWLQRRKPEAACNLIVVGTTDEQFRAALQLRRDKRWSSLPEPGLYARQGEWITCEGLGDHMIARIGQDIRVGSLRDPGDFDMWAQPEPLRGTPSQYCACIMCGCRWFDGMGHFHFKDGWRK